jgi:hypothetical protein
LGVDRIELLGCVGAAAFMFIAASLLWKAGSVESWVEGRVRNWLDRDD